jgi:two-component system NtrC family sensor kinase
MRRIVAPFWGVRLQLILVGGFVLTAAITIGVGTPITYSVINKYLAHAQDARVDRDMDLASAFYHLKLNDLSSTASRLASSEWVQANVAAAGQGSSSAVTVLNEAIDNEILNLPAGSQRFVIITDARGKSVDGEVFLQGALMPASAGTNWADLSILQSALSDRQPLAATEVIPPGVLAWVHLDQQAQIPLIDTPRAASSPFDPREGTAGLALVAVSPILSPDGQLLGSVVAGHLFNNDFTLVDRIKQVAGVDTVTIFFGDLRVSTNVEDELGNRALGTRVSQEVFDQVLVRGIEYTGPAYVVNQNYITRYEPLQNHLGQVIGMLYVGAKQASFQSLVDSFRAQVLYIAAATLLLALLIAIPIAWSIARPLANLADATHKVAQGDWTVRVQTFGYHEMRTLAKSFNTMVQTLKEAQEQLIQKEKLASVGQLAAGVAHEINNPLGSVLLYADILRKETPDCEEQKRSDLEMIINEATRCKTIVNDLLNFSRQNEVLAQETDLNQILCELVEEVGKQDLYRQVTFVQDLQRDLPSIQADPLQLRQVFLNLMNNAAEAMPRGGTLTLRTQQGPVAGMVTVQVQDTGVGISDENMKKIFTPFFTTKPIGKGTGLGLAIIYGIVKMHRGQIGVRSELGRGTTFTVTLHERLLIQNERPAGTFVLQ